MGLIDKMAAFAGYEKRAAIDPSWAALAPGIGYAAGVSARAAENLSTVLACTNVVGDSLGSIPAIVYRTDNGSRIEQPMHPLAKLVRCGANEGMTWPDFVSHLAASALLTGNGLAEILRSGNGQLSGLRYIPWGSVTVSELSSGRLAYDVTYSNGSKKRLLTGEVIHLRDRTDDGLIGRSRLHRAAKTVEGVTLADTHARTFLANGASPSGVLQSDAMLPEAAFNRIKTQMEQRHAGAENVGKTLILDGALKWHSVQISPEDAELLATRKFGVEEICRIFQVPPPLIQDYSHNTFTNSETAGRWFAMFTLAPWARKIEAEFSRSLFPANSGLELEIDLSGFLRGDPDTRWKAHKIALDANVLDPDEVRQVEGWNPRSINETNRQQEGVA